MLTEYRHPTEVFDGKVKGGNGRYLTNKLLEFTNSIETAHRVGKDIEMKDVKDKGGDSRYAEKLGGMFGERMDKMT